MILRRNPCLQGSCSAGFIPNFCRSILIQYPESGWGEYNVWAKAFCTDRIESTAFKENECGSFSVWCGATR